MLALSSSSWSRLGKKIESQTRKALYDFDLIEEKNHIAIALSGGKDSLTLLFMLHAISGKGFPPFKITAIHVGGTYSCGAGLGKGYLHKITETLGIDYIECTSAPLPKLECYSCSRERRRLLFEAAKNAGADTIAFGHHRDDNAQTTMMNLLQKGEFAGMLPKVPMHRYGVTIIRPLIFVEEKEIRLFARQQGFERILCQCPVGQNSVRKKTDQLLNDLQELFPEARANLSKAVLHSGSTKALTI